MRPLLMTTLVLAACGPRALPERSSPVLRPTGAAALLEALAATDSRRDGVFITTSGVVMTSAGAELFRVPRADGPTSARLASHSDALAVAWVGRRLYRFDGTLTDLTDRFVAAFRLSRPLDEPSFLVGAVDVDADGTIAVAARAVGGAPRVQLCLLGATDRCEATATDEDVSVEDLLIDRGRVWVLQDHELDVRAPDGTWSSVATRGQTGSVQSIDPLSDGRAYFNTLWSSTNPQAATVRVLSADGREERSFTGGLPVGHSPNGVWWVQLDFEGAGCGVKVGLCRERRLWTQLVVTHLAFDATQTEVGHLDDPAGELRVLTLPSGGVRLETGDGVFELAAP